MTRSCLRSALLAFALCVAAPLPAPAQTSPPQTREQAQAQEHFQSAKDLYQQGRYNDAIHELELARSLDPKAKDLVFNLGIVHEKLGRFDEAIAFFRDYIEMEGVSAQEKAKAESIIKRIEGAKREVATTSPNEGGAANGSGGDGSDPDPATAHPPEDVAGPRGRVDAATIAAGSVAVVALAAGTFFGVYALTTRPTDFVTGRDGSYADFQKRNDDAHSFAIGADIAIGVGIIAAVATAALYFGRAKAPPRTGVFFGPGMVAGTFR